jgi:acetolactate decarboxylase
MRGNVGGMKRIKPAAISRRLCFSLGCAAAALAAILCPAGDTLMQLSTIDALLAGAYDGTMTLAELRVHGDFGLGTFDQLDGEMAVLDGVAYQIKADGTVHEPPATMKTPFAAVCDFEAEGPAAAVPPGLNYEGFTAFLDGMLTNRNVFVAVRVDGTFRRVHARSVPAQKPPYPLLAVVTKTQPEFHMENARGTLLGFRCPDFVKGIGVPGYHLHFLSDDRTQGGHVLDFAIEAGESRIDICRRFLLVLPGDESGIGSLNLSIDRGAELERVETKRAQ